MPITTNTISITIAACVLIFGSASFSADATPAIMFVDAASVDATPLDAVILNAMPAAATLADDQAVLHAELMTDAPSLLDEIKLRVTLISNPDIDVELTTPVFPVGLMPKPVERHPVRAVIDPDGRPRLFREWHYTLKPLRCGQFDIPPFTAFIGTDPNSPTVSSEPFGFKLPELLTQQEKDRITTMLDKTGESLRAGVPPNDFFEISDKIFSPELPDAQPVEPEPDKFWNRRRVISIVGLNVCLSIAIVAYYLIRRMHACASVQTYSKEA